MKYAKENITRLMKKAKITKTYYWDIKKKEYKEKKEYDSWNFSTKYNEPRTYLNYLNQYNVLAYSYSYKYVYTIIKTKRKIIGVVIYEDHHPETEKWSKIYGGQTSVKYALKKINDELMTKKEIIDIKKITKYIKKEEIKEKLNKITK